MKPTILFQALLFLAYQSVMSQANTEVYVVDLSLTNDKVTIGSPKNISENEGYDNQPSFYDDTTVLFASSKNGQTDIRMVNLSTNEDIWVTNTPFGSEYSPKRIPDSKDISAVRLDTSGLQRLYEYRIKSGKSEEILKDAKVGYYAWIDKHLMINTQLTGIGMNLVLSNLKESINFDVQANVGRSLQAIPNSSRISFVKPTEERNQLWSFDPNTGEIKGITSFKGSQDFCWLPNGILVTGYKNSLYQYNPEGNATWEVLHSFEDADLQQLTRLAVNASGTKLALVSEVSPAFYVDKQLEAYNSRNIDEFLATYADDVELYDFPNQKIATGHDEMRTMYQSFFEQTPDLNCTIKSRTILGNKVIDTEYLTVNGENFTAMAIYELENGKIAKVTFLR